MQYTVLGNTGLAVSRLSFGAMTFTAGNKSIGTVYKTEADDANAMVRRALDAGINFFDTADAYAGGESEAMLGKALKGAGRSWSSPRRWVTERVRVWCRRD